VEFDYIVVGAGAAGCVVAGRLAAARQRPSVLLIEYGGRAVNPLLHVPKGFYYTLRGDRYLYRYLTSPVIPGGGPEVWLRGRVLGGSAAVNGMMWTRGAPADWDGLAARGNPGWSWADALPAYRAIEDHSLGGSETRGAGGPLGISVTDTKDEVSAAILESAVRYGWRPVKDVNAEDTERIGFTPSTIRAGRRTTSYDAFVRPLLARQAAHRAATRLTVRTRTRADRLTFDGRRVTGVKTIDAKGAATEVRARREVILCAGAVETPLLLERSGIGHPGLLRKHGIDPVVESPNVGERVIEQRGVALQVTLKHASAAARRLGTPAGRAREALKWLATGQGLLSTGGYDLVCQFKSAPGAPRPDIQGLFVPMAIDTASKDMRLARHPGILFMAYPIRPETTSSVHISGRVPQDPPVISARFLETDGDRDSVAPVLEIARAVLAKEPVKSLIQAEEFPGPSVAGRQDTIEYSRRTGTGIYHAVGSAAMGPDDDDVTDASLRVRGLAGLRIADASVLPVQVSGNTAAPAMLVGYRAADLVLADSLAGAFLLPPGDEPPDRLDEPAHHQRRAEGHRESHHRLVLERLAADPPGEEGVRGPDNA
jgi:choline dehydrogenase-like flavoprotein